jgi:hypothetical protein
VGVVVVTMVKVETVGGVVGVVVVAVEVTVFEPTLVLVCDVVVGVAVTAPVVPVRDPGGPLPG